VYCRKCGAVNDDNSSKCVQCGEVLQQTQSPAGLPPQQASQQVPNYLVQAILVTLFCCLPFGIVAIVYAAQVNGKLQAGDYQGALDSSKNAKLWTWLGFGIGLALAAIYVAFVAVGIMAGGGRHH
jgi:hypothetical protein